MIIFVGDKPSAKNIDLNIPFVGTQSYKRLLEWIWRMDINISDVIICNRADIRYHCDCGSSWWTFRENILEDDDKVIALGNEAFKDCPNNQTFKLPHPSGKNLQINDKEFIENILMECKEWLKN